MKPILAVLVIVVFAGAVAFFNSGSVARQLRDEPTHVIRPTVVEINTEANEVERYRQFFRNSIARELLTATGDDIEAYERFARDAYYEQDFSKLRDTYFAFRAYSQR